MILVSLLWNINDENVVCFFIIFEGLRLFSIEG